MVMADPSATVCERLTRRHVPQLRKLCCLMSLLLISDEAIGKELSRYGRMVSPIKKIPLG
ncbi:hypothetical protein QTP86_002087 [Hemibagrus guttatus]|nr:hypothetical protein QTP86_002087 [Hemibagrus guttatus]